MAPHLQVADRDLSVFVNVQPGEGLDPAAPFAEPQFSGGGAFGEGLTYIGDSITLREWVIPLILEAADRDSLLQLIEDINQDLTRGAQIEYAIDASVDSISYFDLERGRLDIAYNHFLAQSNITRANLRLWTRPFAHTGTARPIASIAATAAVQFAATGIDGDLMAQARMDVRVGSQVASTGRVVAYGVHRSPSFNAIRGPSSPDFVAMSGATVRGASGAIGSQYLALPVSPTGGAYGGPALTAYITPPAAHVGRHRVFAVMRSRLSAAISLYAVDSYDSRLGPTVTVPANSVWNLKDLGEISVPSRSSITQEGVATQTIRLWGGGASGMTVNASPGLEVNRLILLPLDEAPGVMLTDGTGNTTEWAGDGFFHGAWEVTDWDTYLSYSGNQRWAKIGGNLAAYHYYLVPLTTGLTRAPNASGFYSLGSGAQLVDVETWGSFWMRDSVTGLPSTSCASTVVELWPKQFSASYGYAAKFQAGPSQFLQLMSYTAAGASVMACAGIASTLASTFYTGEQYTMTCRIQGGQIMVWIAGNSYSYSASPVIQASHGAIAQPGWPAVRMIQGADTNTLIEIDNMGHNVLGTLPSGIGSREFFRYEGWPQPRVFQGNASVFRADQTAALRGIPPKIPPTGSAVAVGAQVVVLSGETANFLGNDLLDVNLSVVERFNFLR